MDRVPLCFSCGLPVTSPPRLNDLPDGTPCPICRERALDVVAAALPHPGPFHEELEELEQGQESDLHAADRPFDPPRPGDDYPEPA